MDVIHEAFNKGNFWSKSSFCFPKLGLQASSPWKKKLQNVKVGKKPASANGDFVVCVEENHGSKRKASGDENGVGEVRAYGPIGR